MEITIGDGDPVQVNKGDVILVQGMRGSGKTNTVQRLASGVIVPK